MTPYDELFALAQALNEAAGSGDDDQITRPLRDLEEATHQVGRSSSGSWQGYQSCVYYEEFSQPPPGAHFSQEWGLMDTYGSSHGSRGDWRECDSEEVKRYIRHLAGEPDLEKAHKVANAAEVCFDTAKSEIMSILQGELEGGSDGFLDNLRSELDGLTPLSPFEIAQRLSPKGPGLTRDTVVIGQGVQIPPHTQLYSEVQSIHHAFRICHSAGEIARKAASHLERKLRKKKAADRIGTNVFIGHGRSQVWRDLKDFLQDRLGLPWDEFNRVPVAGITNIARLSEMLDAAAIAFVVMTAEDEMADGVTQARMNVVHEAGLFQGRLGFTRAIVMLEEGCEQFTNIEGLGQIRFPRGNISTAFEEIRRVLERERLIESSV